MSNSEIYKLYCHNNYSGKNYLFGTDFSGSLDSDIIYSRDTSVTTVSTDQTTKHNGYSSLKIVNTAAGASGKDLAIVTLTNDREANGNVADNKEMTLSFWAKASNADTRIYFRWGYGSYVSATLTKDWAYYTLPMNKTTSHGSAMHPYVDKAGTVWITEMQLEDGTEATAFVPEDIKPINHAILTQTQGQKYQLPDDPVREGYTFDGWYTANRGGTKITNQTAVMDGDLIVYAHWNANSYTISFDANGGTGTMDPITVKFGESFVISKSQFTRSGFKQTGWNLYRDADNKYYVAGKGWFTEAEISANGYAKQFYTPERELIVGGSFTKGYDGISTYTFIAVWEQVDCTHQYQSTVVTPATCTEAGVVRYTCTLCGDTYTETLPALGHDIVNDTAVPATCTETGLTAGEHCTRCNYKVAQEVVPALGHNWDAGVVTVQPTETEKGEKTFTCSRCGETKTETIPELSHVHSYTAAVTQPTCTEQGYTTHTCACGDSYVDTYVPALGHNYVDGVCTRCGAKEHEPVSFNDVSPNAWYYGAVDYAVSNGLMNGVGGGNFAPDSPMTRAMLVTVLWRYEGEPKEGKNTFTDVPDGQWYTQAVAWAAANGIVGGVGNGRFDPNGNITREQMAAILFRYADGKKLDTSKRGDLSGFPDAGKVSAWAKDAIAWAVAEKIIGGSDGKLLPQGNATRAQVSTILMRFIENIAKK